MIRGIHYNQQEMVISAAFHRFSVNGTRPFTWGSPPAPVRLLGSLSKEPAISPSLVRSVTASTAKQRSGWSNRRKLHPLSVCPVDKHALDKHVVELKIGHQVDQFSFRFKVNTNLYTHTCS